MFTNRITLFRIFGFAIRLDLSWLILAILIAWSTASGWFGPRFPELSFGTHFVLGLGAALMLLVSIVFHELSHALVARHQGIAIEGITLFLFGGVAEMSEEPEDARSEFWMAIVGPFSSFVLGGIAAAAWWVGQAIGAWPPIVSLLAWTAVVNVMLAVFNLVPAFPLDGGRVLRAALWEMKGDHRAATRIASAMGSGFGLLLIVLGVVQVIVAGQLGGIWLVLIGLFLRAAAKAPYRQLVARQALAGETVRDRMIADPISVPRHVPVSDLVNDYIYRHQLKLFPVVDGDRLVGCVSLEQVRSVPREEWARRSVGEIAEPCTEDNTIRADEEVVDALSKMTRRNITRLMVVDGERLVGVLSLRDLLDFLALKLELEK